MRTESWQVSVHLSLLPFYKYLVLSLKKFSWKRPSCLSLPSKLLTWSAGSMCISTWSVCWVFLIPPSLVLGQISSSASTPVWTSKSLLCKLSCTRAKTICSFHSLLVFLDELLEFEYYCLLLETYVSSLCCNRFNSWFTILFVHFLLTCVFLVQIRFQLELSWSILRLGIPLQRGTSQRGGEKPFTDQIRNGRERSGCGYSSIDFPTSYLFREAYIQSNLLISVHVSKEKKKLLYFSNLIWVWNFTFTILATITIFRRKTLGLVHSVWFGLRTPRWMYYCCLSKMSHERESE